MRKRTPTALVLCLVACGCGGEQQRPSCAFAFNGALNGTAESMCIENASTVDVGGTTRVNVGVGVNTSSGPASRFASDFIFPNPPVTGTYSFDGATLTGNFFSGGIALNVDNCASKGYWADSDSVKAGKGSMTILSVSGPTLNKGNGMSFTVHGSITGVLPPFPGDAAVGTVTVAGTF